MFVLAMAAGCTGPREVRKAIPIPKAAAKRPNPSYWKGDGVVGQPRIVISLARQRAFFSKGDTVVGESPISSGRKGFETPTGSYRVIQRDKDHFSNLYGDFIDAAGAVLKKNADTSKDKAPEGAVFKGAKMPYFLRFHGGYGIHAGRIPGRRASHGCVRLPASMARHFFLNAPIGTPVVLE